MDVIRNDCIRNDCIRNDHMKIRCYFISVMCGMSLYSWYNYSLFDPIINDYFTPYYNNCLFFLFYLFWDTYKMMVYPTLFRKDLFIHHVVSSIVFLSYINNTTLQMSNILILECISLMNYIWKNNPKLLNAYRTLCIFLIRMPLSFWFWMYYNPNIIYPYLKQTRTHYHYLYLKTLGNIYIFFIVYDMFILWQIYKPKKDNLTKV